MRLIVFVALCACLAGTAQAKTYNIKAGVDSDAEAQAVFAQVKSGDEIHFGEGRIALSHPLVLKADKVDIHGKSGEKTVLAFTTMTGEGDGLTVQGAGVDLSNFSIADARGAGLVVGGSNITIEAVAVHKALGPGILLSGAQGAIVQKSWVDGALDGFEVRNSGRVELIDNTATLNGIGVLVDDLPGAPAGGPVRIVRNRINGNSGQGIGVEIMAVKDVAVLQNQIGEHGTANVFIRAYGGEGADAAFDALPRNITVRANQFGRAGFAPAHDWAPATANGAVFGDVVWDGARSYVAGGAPRTEPVLLSIDENTGVTTPVFLSLGLEAAGSPASEANPSKVWPPIAHFAPPAPVKLD